MKERTCSVSWCDRKHHANGLCRTHNERRRKGLDLDTPFRQYEHGERLCKVEGCGRPRTPARDPDAKTWTSGSAGYCPMHLTRVARNGSAGDAAPLRKPKARTAGLPRLERAPNGSPQWNKPEYKREYRLQLDYGMSHDDLLAMLTAQENLCAICGRALAREADPRKKREFAIDHDAVTGKVRGLLCHGCNKGIGFFKDDPCLLARAIVYLATTSGDPCLRGYMGQPRPVAWETLVQAMRR